MARKATVSDEETQRDRFVASAVGGSMLGAALGGGTGLILGGLAGIFLAAWKNEQERRAKDRAEKPEE